MENPIHRLNKVFESRIRLGVMSILLLHERTGFNDLKQLLDVTDGNLASHLQVLEQQGFLAVHKGFVGKKVSTRYTITATGEKAFRSHLAAMEHLIRKLGP